MNTVNCPRLVIAGTHSGVGKTTATLALLAALKAQGRQVQAFKIGPDFIDPGHHAAITGRPSRNLDGWMLTEHTNRQTFVTAAADADLSIIEGMMGLYDGSSPVTDAGSTAEMARQLDAPVLLVMDGSGMARSAAAMASGYTRFDPRLKVAGVLFNRVGGEGHYRLLKEAVEAGSGLPSVGYLCSDDELKIADRHLGLVTAIEYRANDFYARLGRAAAQTMDLDRIQAIAQAVSDVKESKGSAGPASASRDRVRIAVAYDPAFCFYYPENLELLEAEGADIVKFSPLHDAKLPDVDLLYLGGGYPELHGETLAGNIEMRAAIRSFAETGGPVYAECGGMMYLTRSIKDFEGRVHEMVGVFPAEAVMRKRSLTLGYRALEIRNSCVLGPAGTKARGHEFHYSSLVSTEGIEYACVVTDATGERRSPDGLCRKNTVALYTHLHFGSQPNLARALVSAARAHVRAASS